MRRLLLAGSLLALPLAACGGGASTQASGLTPAEEQALNDAAAALDANAVSQEALANDDAPASAEGNTTP